MHGDQTWTEQLSLTIDGRLVEGQGARWEVFNPATEEVLAVVAGVSPGQLHDAVMSSQAAFATWSITTGAERRQYLHRLADAMEAATERLLTLLVNEVGSPSSWARSMQVEMAIEHLRWQADAAAVDRTQRLGVGSHPWPSESAVAFRPAGVVAAIAPYNSPLNLAVFKVGAALAAGCTAVLLPSPRTPLTTLLLGALALEAGLPPGVLNVVAGQADIGQQLTVHPAVDRVSFTGSDTVGAEVMRQASAGLKGVTLELGGKSPSIVLPDVDVQTVATDMHHRWSRNGGQGCAALARLLVHRDVYDAFIDASAVAFDEMRVGDPWDPETTVGPMIRPEHRRRVLGYIDSAIQEGGSIVHEGTRPLPDRGWFVNPVLIGGLSPRARAVQEEIFGPVAVVLPYADEDDAIRLANDTKYGLAANIWTGDVDRGRALAARIRAGTVWINGGGGMRPDAPVGGFGHSGIGREAGEWGIREYLEPQHVQWRL
jgi:acyl-CoA reductase-like NAD-dependent aldehyde dehydrogenase